MGKYELANGLKQEHEKQRVIRRAREEGRVAPHRPRWFVAETDEDVGERVWSPLRVPEDGSLEYWKERVKGRGSGGVPWKDVDVMRLPTEIGLASTNPSLFHQKNEKIGVGSDAR